MNRNRQIKKITDAAIFISITILCEFIARITGGMYGSIFYYLLPIPMILYYFKHKDFKYLFGMFVSIVIISFIVLNPFEVLLICIPSLITGILMILLMRNKKHVFLIITLASASFLLFDIINTYALSYVFNLNVIEELKLMANEISKILPFGNESASYFAALLIGVYPSILFLTSVMGTIICYFLSILLIRRLNIDASFTYNKKMFVTPKFIVFAYIIAFILTIISLANINYSNDVIYFLECVILNVFAVLSFLFVFLGLVFIGRYSKIKQKPYIYVFAIVLLFILPVIHIILGIVYIFKQNYLLY